MLPLQHQRLGFHEKAKTKECYHTVAQALEALEEKGLLKSGKEAGHRHHHHIGGYELLQNIKSLAFSGCQTLFPNVSFRTCIFDRSRDEHELDVCWKGARERDWKISGGSMQT